MGIGSIIAIKITLIILGLYMQICDICTVKQSIMDLKKLREIRKMRKVSITQVSKDTGMNRNRISLIERGMVNPSFDTVEAIAQSIGAEIIIVLRP